MTAILEPPKRVGNAAHFQKTLENIAKVRPRYPIDTWSDYDAARFWVHDFDAEPANHLTPLLILGIVARLVVRFMWNHPEFHPMFRRSRVVFHAQDCHDFSLNRLCRSMHRSYFPAEDSGPDLENPALSIAQKRFSPGDYSYCHRKSCEHQASWVGGCIPEYDFGRYEDENCLVPWSMVNWGGMACWLPPMRKTTTAPYIAIRKARSHLRKPLLLRSLADQIELFHYQMPHVLLTLHSFQAFRERIRLHVDALTGERLRYLGMKASHPDCDDALARWDRAFEVACWSFGKRDCVYSNYTPQHWLIDQDKWHNISDNQPEDLFPKVPDWKDVR